VEGKLELYVSVLIFINIGISHHVCRLWYMNNILCLTGVVTGERTRLVVFGVARIHRTRLLATLSGLKLEAEITNLHSSLTCRKKSRPASLECSLTGHIGRTMIVLLEGVAPNQQLVLHNDMHM
jgi:hypothetical protein